MLPFNVVLNIANVKNDSSTVVEFVHNLTNTFWHSDLTAVFSVLQASLFVRKMH